MFEEGMLGSREGGVNNLLHKRETTLGISEREARHQLTHCLEVHREEPWAFRLSIIGSSKNDAMLYVQ